MPEIVGTNEAGELVYRREDGSEFVIPAGVWGMGRGVEQAPTAAPEPFEPPPVPQPQREPLQMPPDDPGDLTQARETLGRVAQPFVHAGQRVGEGLQQIGEGFREQQAQAAAEEEARQQRAREIGEQVARRAHVGASEADAIEAQDAAEAHRTQAAQFGVGALMSEAQARADIAGRTIEAEEQHQRELADSVASLNKAREEGKQEIAEFDQRISEGTLKPGKGFRDKPVWSKILTVLSVAIGGYMAPLQGGRNVALEMFEKFIEQDVKAQQANLAKLERERTRRVADIDLEREMHANAIVDTNLRLASRLREIEAEGQRMLQSEAVPLQAQERLHNLLTEIADRRAEVTLDAQRRHVDYKIAEEKLRLQKMALGLRAMQRAGTGQAAEDPSVGKLDQTTRAPSGQFFFEGRPVDRLDLAGIPNEDARKLEGEVRSVQDILNNVATVSEILGSDPRRKVIPDKQRRAAKALLERLVLSGVERLGGRPTDAFAERFQNMIGTRDPEKALEWLSPEERMEVVQLYANSMLNETQTRLRQKGVEWEGAVGTPIPNFGAEGGEEQERDPIKLRDELLAAPVKPATTPEGRAVDLDDLPELPEGRIGDLMGEGVKRARASGEMGAGVHDEVTGLAERFLDVEGMGETEAFHHLRIGIHAVAEKQKQLMDRAQEIGRQVGLAGETNLSRLEKVLGEQGNFDAADEVRALRNMRARLGILGQDLRDKKKWVEEGALDRERRLEEAKQRQRTHPQAGGHL